MLTLITGGSKSGKSRLGEAIACAAADKKYYIATMEPFGSEAETVIERHRRARAGKGFITVERYADIGKTPVSGKCSVLLEDMGNLLANEMFSAKTENPVGKIVSGIKELNVKASHLIVVTNQIGGDGLNYPPETTEYIRAMGETNRLLAEMADCLIEAVFGIPLILKGEKPPCL